MWEFLVTARLFNNPSNMQTGNDKIRVGDLKLFLMAICSIKGNKRMGIQRDNFDSDLTYGWINDNSQLCLSTHDAAKIAKKFANLSLNRNKNRQSSVFVDFREDRK